MSTSGLIKWGILGTGKIANDFASALQGVEGASLHAVASRDSSRSASFARRWQSVQNFGGYKEAVLNSGADVFYIATPNAAHEEHVSMCLEHGRPVLCEKPFMVDAETARAVTSKAAEASVFCMEALWTRFIPAVRRAKEILDAGTLGEVHYAEANFGFVGKPDELRSRLDVGPGAGVTLDLGVYPVSILYHLLGGIVQAKGVAAHSSDGVDIHASFVLQGEQGYTASCTVSYTSVLPGDLVIRGSKGTLTLQGPLCSPRGIWLDLNEGQPKRPAWVEWNSLLKKNYQRYENRLRPHLLRQRQYTKYPVTGNGLQYQIRHVNECLASGVVESSIMPHNETVRVLEILDMVRGSFGSGVEVTQ